MKTIISTPIGTSGVTASLALDGGNLVAAINAPVAQLVTPLNDVLDKAFAAIENTIPGDWDKAILDPILVGAKAELLALLSE